MALLAAAMILLSSGSATPDEQTTLLAHQVGVDPLELQGALNTTGAAPVAYLMYEGLIEPPSASSSPAAPTSGGFSSRVACIIRVESHGNPRAYNRSGASGLGQFLPSTWMTTPQGKAGQSVWEFRGQHRRHQLDDFGWTCSRI